MNLLYTHVHKISGLNWFFIQSNFKPTQSSRIIDYIIFFLCWKKKNVWSPNEKKRVEDDWNQEAEEEEENIQNCLLHVRFYVCMCLLLNWHEYSIAWDCMKFVPFDFMYYLNVDHHNADGVFACVCFVGKFIGIAVWSITKCKVHVLVSLLICCVLCSTNLSLYGMCPNTQSKWENYLKNRRDSWDQKTIKKYFQEKTYCILVDIQNEFIFFKLEQQTRKKRKTKKTEKEIKVAEKCLWDKCLHSLQLAFAESIKMLRKILIRLCVLCVCMTDWLGDPFSTFLPLGQI